ncbi:glycosyltransferase family 2 protein [Candidatus Roizmanbacteria bacterium]|nr:glycosyltransferase family 2 protein [Candidatus Roizmanbacteria bacterium]
MNKIRISLLMITKNSGELLEKSLQSVKGLVDEMLIVDDNSNDDTLNISRKYKAKIYKRHDENLGSQRAYGLAKCKGDWVLMLDADEVISTKLKDELASVISFPRNDIFGYYIHYQNHFLGKPIYYGGEDYKILRLFKKNAAYIPENLIHEHVKVDGQIGELKGKIYHYSYRTLQQTFTKFTDYAKREATRKLGSGEKTSLKKIIFYPFHMFWARYIKDHGYKDFSLRILLDLGFAYMEWLTYVFMLFYKDESKKDKYKHPIG